jgi:cell volume regulation protein A
VRLTEPQATAWLFLTAALLLVVAVLGHRLSRRLGLPFYLLSLAVGMLAGSDGLGGIAFDDYGLAFRIGTASLLFILFDGGVNTRRAALRRAIVPGGLLATVGVAATMAMFAAGGVALGLGWGEALLIGAVVSSTDSAAVFSLLRGSGIALKPRPAATIEVESGLNDPVAVLLTLAAAGALAEGRPPSWTLPLAMAAQLAIGAGAGYALGKGAAFALRRLGLAAGGLFTVFSLAFVLLAFAVPTVLWGSGFLAVYVAGLTLADAKVPYRAALVRFHDGVAWLAQIAMFVLLGLLVYPSRLAEVAPLGLALGLLLILVARPLVVAACLAPLRLPWREILFVGLVGLRGATPIVLATIPVLGGVPGSERLFDLVFFVVLVSGLLPGAATRWLARRLRVDAIAAPPPRAVLEFHASEPLDGDIVSFEISPALAVAHAAIRDLPLAEGTSVLLVVRGRALVAPRGDTVLQPGDHVYLFAREHDRPLLSLLFGAPESGTTDD